MIELPKETVYVVDGNAMIRRAFHVSLNTKMVGRSGEPTQTAFIFTRMLFKFLQNVEPVYLVIVFDNKTSHAARKKVYPDYKKKDEDPEEKAQFLREEAITHQIIAEMKIQTITYPGYEADDVMATLAEKFSAEGRTVALATADKDLIQCVGDSVLLYDFQKYEVLGPNEIREKKGFWPYQSLEVQTLTGDATDNIPGIPGIGNKTAAKLLDKYDTIEGIYDNLSALTPKLREKLEEFRLQLSIAKMLVRLYTDLPIDIQLEPFTISIDTQTDLQEAFVNLGFQSLLGDLFLLGSQFSDREE